MCVSVCVLCLMSRDYKRERKKSVYVSKGTMVVVVLLDYSSSLQLDVG